MLQADGHWLFGEFACKLYQTVYGISQFASVTFIAVLSFDR